MSSEAVSLGGNDARRLRELAERLGLPLEDVVRLALDMLEPQQRSRRFLHFDSGAGDGRSVADVPDDELLSGFGE